MPIKWVHPKKQTPLPNKRLLILLDDYGTVRYGTYNADKKKFEIQLMNPLDVRDDTVKAWAYLNIPDWANYRLK
jgi:hypothetical protein